MSQEKRTYTAEEWERLQELAKEAIKVDDLATQIILYAHKHGQLESGAELPLDEKYKTVEMNTHEQWAGMVLGMILLKLGR